MEILNQFIELFQISIFSSSSPIKAMISHSFTIKFSDRKLLNRKYIIKWVRLFFKIFWMDLMVQLWRMGKQAQGKLTQSKE